MHFNSLLKQQLDATIISCDATARRLHDPVDIVWHYDEPRDQEVVALITSCLAYGRVELLKKAVWQVLKPLGGSPSGRILAMNDDEMTRIYSNFIYRMTRGADIIDLLWAIKNLLLQFESLEQAYRAADEQDHLEAVKIFCTRLRSERYRTELSRGFKFLVPDPRLGGACKRMHLFFRWMSRGPDQIDRGLWRSVAPSQLIMPMDTHTSRICAYLGLTTRRQVDAKMAMEVTTNLRALDKNDPLRYDFALCHLGISRQCIHKRSDEHCPSCPINLICKLT